MYACFVKAFSPKQWQMLRDLTGFDDPVELFDALDTNEKGEVGAQRVDEAFFFCESEGREMMP